MADITDRESFEKWLEGQPNEWAQVLATRTALRVLPLVGRVFDAGKLKPKIQQELVFANFGAAIMSWVEQINTTSAIRIYIADASDVAARAAFNTYAARNFTRDTTYNSDADFSAASAAFVAASAAFSAANAARCEAANTVFSAVNAAEAAYTTRAADAAARAADDIWKAINQDVGYLENYNIELAASAKALAKQALWLNDEGKNAIPVWAKDETKKLAQILSGLNDNWHVWTEWYQSRLQGTESWGLKPKNAETLMLRIAKQENEWWEQGPTIVNAEIAGWLADLRAEEAREEFIPDKSPATPAQELADNNAATSFIVRNGKFDVAPTNAWANDVERAEGLRKLAENLASKMQEQLANTNAEPGLAANITAGLNILKQPVLLIQPDQLRLFAQSISALARTYGHPNAEWELSAEIVQSLFEFSALLEDLQGFVVSDLKENSEAIRALDISPTAIEDVKLLNDDVTMAVQSHGSLFSDTASNVFETASTLSENTPNQHVQVMVEGERILLTENLAVAIARELAKSDVQSALSVNANYDDANLMEFKDRFLSRLSDNLPEDIADALKKGIFKPIENIGLAVAAIVFAFGNLGIIGVASTITIAAAWIFYELRRRISELDEQSKSNDESDEAESE